MWLDRKWVGKIVSLTPSITWKIRSFGEQYNTVIIIIILFSFWIMIIAAYYLLLLFYEITKLQRYWLVNLGAFVKWTHRAQIFLLQLDIFNDFSASSSISTLNLVSCSSKIIIFIYSLIHTFITINSFNPMNNIDIYYIKRLNIQFHV